MKRLTAIVFALSLFSLTHSVQSQERVTLVAPFPPGGPVDTLARILADGLQKKYAQVVVVENLPGASGNLGIDKVKSEAGWQDLAGHSCGQPHHQSKFDVQFSFQH